MLLTSWSLRVPLTRPRNRLPSVPGACFVVQSGVVTSLQVAHPNITGPLRYEECKVQKRISLNRNTAEADDRDQRYMRLSRIKNKINNTQT